MPTSKATQTQQFYPDSHELRVFERVSLVEQAVKDISDTLSAVKDLISLIGLKSAEVPQQSCNFPSIGQPVVYSGLCGSWEEWIDSYERYGKLARWSDNDHVTAMPIFLSDRALIEYKEIGRTKGQLAWADLRSLMDKRFAINYVRHDMLEPQEEGECVAAYYSRAAEYFWRCKIDHDPVRCHLFIANLLPRFRNKLLCEELNSLAAAEEFARKLEYVEESLNSHISINSVEMSSARMRKRSRSRSPSVEHERRAARRSRRRHRRSYSRSRSRSLSHDRDTHPRDARHESRHSPDSYSRTCDLVRDFPPPDDRTNSEQNYKADEPPLNY